MQGLHLDGQVAKYLGEPSIVLGFHQNYWDAKWGCWLNSGNGLRELWLQFLGSGAQPHAVLSTCRVAPLTAYDGAESNQSPKYSTA